MKDFFNAPYLEDVDAHVLYELRSQLESLIVKWLDWNEKHIQSHDFCMEFEKALRKPIRQKIKRKQSLKKKILRQMVRK